MDLVLVCIIGPLMLLGLAGAGIGWLICRRHHPVHPQQTNTMMPPKLRRQHLAAASLMVFIKTNRFKPEEPQYYATQPVRLPVTTSDSAKLIGAALAGLGTIWRNGYHYKRPVCFCSVSIRSQQRRMVVQ